MKEKLAAYLYTITAFRSTYEDDMEEAILGNDAAETVARRMG
jgi:hypothetical protein